MHERLLADLFKDVRYALRGIRRSPLFSSVAILSLALGIGGAASVFTVLNAVLLRNLPVPNPQQLFSAVRFQRGESSPRYSWPSFEQARDALSGRAELCAATDMVGMQVRPVGEGTPTAERVFVQLVSGEFFDVFRQRPQAGRLFNPSDNASLGAHPVAVISDGYWERRFRRAPAAIGRDLVVNGASFTIVGVAAPEFFGPSVGVRNPEVWVPLLMQPAVRYASNASNSANSDPLKPWPPQAEIEWLGVYARIAKPETPANVAATLTTLHRQEALSRLDPGNAEGREAASAERVILESASRGVSFLRTELHTPLIVLLAMVGVLAAIAAGNVASLLLSRASARDRELAIRLAIGAGRARLVRQLLTETLLLAMMGAVLGLMAAAWGRDALLAMFAPASAAIDLDTSFDWRVLAFVIGLTTVTGVCVGILPALRSTRVPLVEALKLQSRTVGAEGGRRGMLVGRMLVSAQIAFCLLLLVIAGLFVRSMQSLTNVEVGFDRSRVLVARLDVRSLGYSNDERQALYRRVSDAISAVPGVVSASLSLNGPLGSSSRRSSLSVEGYTPARDERMMTNEEVITDDYLATVGLRVVEGRGFEPDDRLPGRRSTLINETMARRYFAGRSPLGKRWSYGGDIGPDAWVIVGVVEDAKYLDVRGAPPTMAYRLSAASPDEVLGNLEVRTAGRPADLSTTVQQALNRSTPELPLYDVVSLEARLNRGLSNDALIANLSSVFGGAALLLASLGLYGTVSYGVARRVSELGVRMALGAARSAVLWLVMREALALVVIGGLVGLPLAFAAGRSLGTLLYGVPPLDPVSYAGGAALLTFVAGTAAWLPAYRASRIDPMVALRKE